MPRRSIVPAAFDEPMLMASNHHKTKRSHEENQERAYIAASRRSDRCIEARVQSAHMASKIHKKRTGRAFKITKEIVLNDEMYKEENNNLPRSHRLLGANLQTASADMNTSMEADLANKIKVSEMLAKANEEWRENEINRLFALSFPNALLPFQQKAQMISNGTVSQYSVGAHSPTAYAPISHSIAPGLTDRATPSRISVSATHHHQAVRNRRRSCTLSSPTSSSRKNSFQAAFRLPNSPSPEITSTASTAPSIESSASPKVVVDSTTSLLTLVNQKVFEFQGLSNSEMHDIAEMSQVNSGFVLDHYNDTADVTNAGTSCWPSIADDDPWHAFINDATRPSDLQH